MQSSVVLQSVSPSLMSNGVDAAFVSPGLEAVSVYPLSELSTVRLLNVATPSTASSVVVPPSVAVPPGGLTSAIVTGAEVSTMLPLPSTRSTVSGGPEVLYEVPVMTSPMSALFGWPAILSAEAHVTGVVRLLLAASKRRFSPKKPPSLATVNHRLNRLLQFDGAVAVTDTCKVEPAGRERRSRITTLKNTYACPRAPAGKDASVTLNPSGGISAADESPDLGEDVFVRATSNVVELPAGAAAGGDVHGVGVPVAVSPREGARRRGRQRRAGQHRADGKAPRPPRKADPSMLHMSPF